MDEVLQAILVIGGALGCEERARALVQDMSDEVRQIREYSSVWPDRPRVYFEEWPEPLIVGIRWVSEAIEVAGGRDVFPELRSRARAPDRVVASEEVVRATRRSSWPPGVASPVDRAAIAARAGWASITAVKRGEIHELDGADIPSPGPPSWSGCDRSTRSSRPFKPGAR